MLKQLNKGGVYRGVFIVLSMALILALAPGQASADTAEEIRATIIESQRIHEQEPERRTRHDLQGRRGCSFGRVAA